MPKDNVNLPELPETYFWRLEDGGAVFTNQLHIKMMRHTLYYRRARVSILGLFYVYYGEENVPVFGEEVVKYVSIAKTSSIDTIRSAAKDLLARYNQSRDAQQFTKEIVGDYPPQTPKEK